MNVLSLFDGMSCCQIALDRLGIKVDNYYSSEIKKHAIKVTQHNYPNTIQLGDVREIKGNNLPNIDLLTFGSPCQDLSIANKERKGLDGKKSSLFLEAIRLLKEIKPKYFLMENVVMPQKDCDIITRELGVFPIRINSSLVSAQLRDRLYWTNIPGDSITLLGNEISQPEDKKIMLQDILETGFTDRSKARALLESESRPLKTPEKMAHRYFDIGFTTLIFKDCEIFYLAEDPESRSCLRVKENTKKGYVDVKEGDDVRYFTQTELERLQTVPEGYTKCLTRNQAACVLGDGWTVDVIAHILKGIKVAKI